MKIKLLLLSAFLFAITTSCKRNKVVPISERIQKTYRAQSVSHDGTEVYSNTGGSNIVPNYSNFSMSFSPTGTVSFRDITPQTFSGQYQVNDYTLTLNGLNPEPTGSNGSLTFNISAISDDGKQLTLSANKANPKTGNTRNVYHLIAN